MYSLPGVRLDIIPIKQVCIHRLEIILIIPTRDLVCFLSYIFFCFINWEIHNHENSLSPTLFNPSPAPAPSWTAVSAMADLLILVSLFGDLSFVFSLGYFSVLHFGWIHAILCSSFLIMSSLCVCVCAHACVLSCDPNGCSPPGSSVHGVLQARILEQAATPSSRGSFQPRDRTCVSCTGR